MSWNRVAVETLYERRRDDRQFGKEWARREEWFQESGDVETMPSGLHAAVLTLPDGKILVGGDGPSSMPSIKALSKHLRDIGAAVLAVDEPSSLDALRRHAEREGLAYVLFATNGGSDAGSATIRGTLLNVTTNDSISIPILDDPGRRGESAIAKLRQYRKPEQDLSCP